MSEMEHDAALEYSDSLSQIYGGILQGSIGTQRQILLAFDQGVPGALGMSRRQWVDQYIGYQKMSVEVREKIIAALLEEGYSQRQIADAVGVDEKTVRNDLAAEYSADEAESQPPDETDDAEYSAPSTSAEVLQAAKEIKSKRRKDRDAERAEQRAAILESDHPLAGEFYSVFVHDIREGAPDIATPAAVVTDPPYPKKYLPLYGALDALAAASLPAGGSLLAMCGESHLGRIFGEITQLCYQWTLGYFTPGESTQVQGRKVKSNWKPVLWYVNGKYTGEHVEDTIRSDGNDKRFHDWGQSVSGMAALIERFTVPGDLVYDPFCGGGTTGVAALLTGRLFIGSDIDEACVKQTAARLAEVSP